MASGSSDPARALVRPVEPPAELKRRVLQRLRALGLIASPPGRQRPLARVLAYAAAAVLLVASGALARGGWPTGSDTRPRFALFLYEDDRFQPTVSHRELVAEYSAWADTLRKERKLVMAEELDLQDSALLARSGDTLTISPGDVQTVAGRLAGLFIVRAGTMQEAAAIARQCPHLKYGGRVALRRLMQ